MDTKDLQIGDWVIATSECLVPLDIDASTYVGMPCVVTDIGNDRVVVHSPLKVCFGKPPIDSIPICQLVKVDPKIAEEHVKELMATDTYDAVRARCQP